MAARPGTPGPAGGEREADHGRGAAFFDLDRTLIAGSSGLPWARAARRAGLVSRRQMAGWATEHLRFRLRGSTDAATEKVMAEVKALLRGVPERQIARLAPEVLAGILPRLYPAMLDEINDHIEAGRPTFIVSAAGDEIVKLIARVLSMRDGIGTAYEVDPEGRLTGELGGAFMYGEGKVEAMRRLAEEHDIDLAESFAYSDSVSDLPMLRAVGHPVVVNPDSELTALARANGWRVMRFEKLGRRLVVVGAMALAAAAGIGGRRAYGVVGRLRSS